MARGRKGGGKAQDRPSLLEWIAAGIGTAIVCTMFGLLAWDALGADPNAPPVMEISPVALHVAGGSYVLDVEVVNRSASTAAAVEIAGELKSGDSLVETSNATLSYVPGRAERGAALVFTRDPRAHQLELRVTGFEYP